MTKYFQPIINFGPDPIKGSLFLSDRNFWFDKVKVLQRGRKPFIINSNDVPKKVIKDITNSFNYYGDENSEKILSLDLDSSDNFNYLSFQNFDNLVFEKELKLSLIELIEQENVDKLRNSSNFINNENDNFIKNIINM